MVRKILLALAVSFYLSFRLVIASPIEVNTYDTVEIVGPDILLGDIAVISGDNLDRVAALKSLKIGNAASPGNSVVFTNELLGMRLSAAGGDYTDITWQIKQPVIVTTKAQSISADMLIAFAEDYIKEQIGTAKIFHIDHMSIPNAVIAPDGNLSFRVDLPYGIRYNAPTNAIVNIYINDYLYNKSNIRFKVRSYEKVVVINRTLPRKYILTKEDVRLENSDTSKLEPGYITDIDQVIGLVTKRVLQDGTPLSKNMLEKPVIIKRMAMVNIVSNINGIVVKVDGQALQDGREGSFIRVKNVNSNKIVSGKVIDSSTVEVLTHKR
ncbi:flagellar basal body P-ring formation chaperone FlgA [Anaerosinus massiliensis]|uniref:flagellar basal body P-ring formation chaperone FlgA n=1 Tax=Massilibacillus massiliensis TaxID=1806837 RepID=UPI000DA5ED77|nr:flagellar basal body P-ring formation chaperone FlgA [Massilibacillus massiliensis]